jgi:GNAT superfamily N-acetyltransferase
MPRHASALAEQYRNPDTAAMTGLPELGEELDAAGWIDIRRRESPATYAFMHARFGFVGYGDLFLNRDEGYLCMWLGEDYRGRGWGKVLVHHLGEFARQAGLSVIWSSAYQHNTPSLRSLSGAGFHTLDMRALPPDEERQFVYLPLRPWLASEARAGMADFCDRTQTGVRFDDVPARDIPSTKPSEEILP